MSQIQVRFSQENVFLGASFLAPKSDDRCQIGPRSAPVYFFFLYQSPSLLLCMVFDSISSNIDKVLSINLSANVFVFGDFNIHHKDWLTYSGGTDTLGELYYSFSISNNLTRMVNFPTQIPDCDSHSLALLDLFLSSDASICSTMVMLLSQFPLTFQ